MHFLAEDYGGPKVVHRERSAVVGVSLDPDSHANEEEDKSKSAMNLWSVVQNETDRIVMAKRTEQSFFVDKQAVEAGLPEEYDDAQALMAAYRRRGSLVRRRKVDNNLVQSP